MTAMMIDDLDDVRRRVFEAIDRPLSDMTVEEICGKADISKQTFYNRFTSKFDIANWFANHYEELFLTEIGRTLTWEQGYSLLFQTYESRGAFMYLTSIDSKDDGSTTKARRRAAIVQTLEAYRGVNVDQKAAIFIEALLELEVFLVGEWFRARLNPPAEQFADIFVKTVPRELYDLMQLPREEAESRKTANLFARYYEHLG